MLNTSQIQLFCFPHAGGSTSFFMQWEVCKHLSSNIVLHPIDYPGHGYRSHEPLINKFNNLIEDLLAIIIKKLSPPFALYGHSFGSLIAFELSYAIHASTGLWPVHYFASGHQAPHLENANPKLSALSNDDFLKQIDFLYHGIPIELKENKEVLAYFLELLKTDFSLLDQYTYVPRTPLPCAITVFGGDEDRVAHFDIMKSWSIHTQNTFHAVRVPGDHFSMLNSSNLRGEICKHLLFP